MFVCVFFPCLLFPLHLMDRVLEPIPASYGQHSLSIGCLVRCSRAPRQCSEGVPVPPLLPERGPYFSPPKPTPVRTERRYSHNVCYPQEDLWVLYNTVLNFR